MDGVEVHDEDLGMKAMGPSRELGARVGAETANAEVPTEAGQWSEDGELSPLRQRADGLKYTSE